MERERQEAVIEAVLFTMGESVSVHKLAELIDDTPSNTRKLIAKMQENLKAENRGISFKIPASARRPASQAPRPGDRSS